jgi:molybdenum cofactor guanylyltransferase
MKKHQKHAKLAKPEMGAFGRNEIAFVGAPCDLVQEICHKLIPDLGIIKCTYIDADHAFGDTEIPAISTNELIDKIKFYRHDKKEMNDFDKKIALNDQDLILVNGNHFEAQKQLVFIHPKKEASLKKRIDQLTDVQAYILCEDVEKPFDWLVDSKGEKPVLKLETLSEIANLILKSIQKPLIKGLVLAGGKSQRMGTDKGQIEYHGQSQVDYLLAEFSKAGIDAFVSCRPEQYEDYERITDKFEGLGPYGAILSAFQSDPNSAWLVAACDLPLIDSTTFELLKTQRDQSKLATCFYNPETDFPDPLITLWEPKSYMRLLEFLAFGYSCPRKVLINSDVKMVKLENPEILKNVNTPEEKENYISSKS